jgi:hypothetical protein
MENSLKATNLRSPDHKGSGSSGPGGFYKLKLRGTVRVFEHQKNFVHVVVAFREDSEFDIDEYITKDRADKLNIRENSQVTVEFITTSVKI